jgi:biotin carboxyl carrier protein
MPAPKFQLGRRSTSHNMIQSRKLILALTLATVASFIVTLPMAATPVTAPDLSADFVSLPTGPAPQNTRSSEFWLSGNPIQGGLVTGRVPHGARSVLFNGSELPVTPDGFFLMGFDRDAENSFSLVALYSDGQRTERHFSVAPGNWRIENVAANPTGGAATTVEFQARRGAELARINAARAIHSTSNGWRQEFVKPVAGRISGLFGAQRVYNGTPGSYHGGMDIAAPSGTAFVAPAHGMGLGSAFLHCSQLLVKKGDAVKQGQVIGRVGATGRASGPHLHWGMKWNSARIDPKRLVPPV